MGSMQAFQGKLAQIMAGKASRSINHGVRCAQSRKSHSECHIKTDKKKRVTMPIHAKSSLCALLVYCLPKHIATVIPAAASQS
jgi:hypothetical protein